MPGWSAPWPTSPQSESLEPRSSATASSRHSGPVSPRQARTVELVEMVERNAGARHLEDPAQSSQLFQVELGDDGDEEVEDGGNDHEVERNEERMLYPMLAYDQDDGQEQRNGPEKNGIQAKEPRERRDVVLQVPLEPGRDLNARSNKKPTDAADATDQDVSREESDERAEPTGSHGEEDQASEDGAERIGQDGGGQDGARIVVADASEDGEGHLMEEGDDLDLTTVSRDARRRRQRSRGFRLTISEPIPPLKALPPQEKTSCETMQLT